MAALTHQNPGIGSVWGLPCTWSVSPPGDAPWLGRQQCARCFDGSLVSTPVSWITAGPLSTVYLDSRWQRKASGSWYIHQVEAPRLQVFPIPVWNTRSFPGARNRWLRQFTEGLTCVRKSKAGRATRRQGKHQKVEWKGKNESILPGLARKSSTGN